MNMFKPIIYVAVVLSLILAVCKKIVDNGDIKKQYELLNKQYTTLIDSTTSQAKANLEDQKKLVNLLAEKEKYYKKQLKNKDRIHNAFKKHPKMVNSRINDYFNNQLYKIAKATTTTTACPSKN